MTNEEREAVALFRFGVISDLVSGTRLDYGETERLLKQKSRQRWTIPCSNRTRISASTIRRWVRIYEGGGRKFAALAPAGRSDRGRSRRVDDETIHGLVKLKKEKPSLPVVRLIAEMEQKELIGPGIILSQATAGNSLDPASFSDQSSESNSHIFSAALNATQHSAAASYFSRDQGRFSWYCDQGYFRA